MNNSGFKTNFTEKVVIVTGGAWGIGKKIAESFGRKGGKIAICDINVEESEKTCKEFHNLGIFVKPYICDLTGINISKKIISKIANDMNGIDILINNASFRPKTDLFEESEETWDSAMDLNLKSAFFCSQAAIQFMLIKKDGIIVNIGSTNARFIGNQSPSYHMSKCGLEHLTRYLAKQAGHFGVRVNCIAPGVMLLDEHKEKYYDKKNEKYRKIVENYHPIGKIGSSEDIANACNFLCTDEASFITGQTLVIDGGAGLHDNHDFLFKFEEFYKSNFL